MKKYFLILSLVLVFYSVKATPQLPDYLIYKGRILPIFSNPLESYLEQNNLLAIDRGCNSSSCNRGYVATWELKNDSLYLIKIEHYGAMASAGVYTGLECDTNKISDIMNYFNQQFKNQKNFCNWYSGVLLSPQGRLIEYVHADYKSTYESEQHFTIKNGTLESIDFASNNVKPELFDEFNYALIVDTLFHNILKLDWNYLEEKLLCSDSYLITLNKNREVSTVKCEPLLNSKWENFWYNFSSKKCRHQIKRSIKNIEFKKYLKGEPKRIVVNLNLIYEEGKLSLSQ